MTGLRVVCLLLLLVQTSSVQGSCYSQLTSSTYCMVDEATRIEANEWYLTPDCYNCTCRVGSMSCCGVGIKAGRMKLPKGYKVQLVPPCDFIIVPESE